MIRKATKRLGRPPLVENRREFILVSAAKLFGQVGYDKCSMRDISDATNVSKGTLYHYFKTKQEIYDAIFLNTLRRMVDFVSGAVNSEDGARRKLEKFFRAHAEYFDAHYWEFNATMLGLAGVSSRNASRGNRAAGSLRRYRAAGHPRGHRERRVQAGRSGCRGARRAFAAQLDAALVPPDGPNARR